MNGVQSRKGLSAEKPFPGCLGRMVNLFDLSPGIAGNRMLMDRPHQDGSSLARSQSDVSRTSSPFGDKIEDKLIVSELRRTASSNKKSNGTPMKMLLDQEMSKEIDSRNDLPNVVAKLMGLEELPRHQPHSLQRSHTNGYSRSGLSRPSTPLGSWQQEFEAHPERPNEYKDVYEVWQQKQPPPPQQQNVNHHHYSRENSPQKERNANDSKKMALIRQKFMEAKRLATDEKLRQSKEFHDALEVLSSDRDLFLKFLQEPNSLFSPNIYESQSVPPTSETKRITVLKPSKIAETEKTPESRPKSDNNNNNKQIKSPAQAERLPMFSIPKIDEYPTQPTRIVVLKPSTGKTHDIRAVVSSPTSSPRPLHSGNLEEEDDDEARESREVAKQITRHVRDNLMGHRRDETLLSSVFSNGYTGDESSFNKSENGYRPENLSDSEVMSPPSSRHSWDYINRLGSPFSSSSFSRASCSPESSVCREAKKRLSERWAMVASNGISQEQRHVRRSSSTLGEMLALSDVVKISAKSDDEIKEEPPELTESNIIDSPRSLVRSKSVPGLSTVYDGSDSSKTDGPKELSKAKSSKSSLRGKVSSLFFLMSKKSSKEKLGSSESQSGSEGQRSLVPPGNAVTQSGNESERAECLPPQTVGLKHGRVPREAGLSLAKPMIPGIAIENQDQPSPISVLEPPFEEDDNIIREASGHLRLNPLGGGQLLRSNLLDKSPPIGSIARTLSWDESCLPETATSAGPFQLRHSPVPTLPEEDQEYWLGFVRTLLSAAGLESGTRCDSLSSSFPRWQSPEAPLDRSSRDKYAETGDDGEKNEPMMMMAVLHEAKRRRLRSVKKLVFDRVNSILADITTTTSGSVGPVLVVDRVWDRMKEWFSGGEVRCLWEECGDPNSLVVDGVVRRELVGNGWAELLESEIGNLGKEIERKLLEELMEEAVVDFTDKI